MMTLRCWARTIPALWFSIAALAAPAAKPPHAPAPAKKTEKVVPLGGLRLLAEGVEALDVGHIPQAIHALKGARTAVPALQDYADYFLAQANYQGRYFADAAEAAERVVAAKPVVPTQARAALVGAKAYLELKEPRKALALLARLGEGSLPMPDGRLVRARALEANGALIDALSDYQVVYFQYPRSDAAREAADALPRLSVAVGAKLVHPPELRLVRADKLRDGGDKTAAKRELHAVLSEGNELERAQARIRLAALDYEERDTVVALRALDSMGVQKGEAEAERLYWMVQCNRRLERDNEMAGTLAELERGFTNSPWRLKALQAAANRFSVIDDARQEGVFASCAESFPDAKEAPICQWRTAFWAYRHRETGAAQLLRQHLMLYPGSEKSGAAIFYLGRISQRAGDNASALAWFRFMTKRYPNYYYSFIARPVIEKLEAQRVEPSAAVQEFLAKVKFPERPSKANFTAEGEAARRIERARLLDRAELDNWAEQELRFSVNNGVNPWPLVLELAEIATRNGAPDRALRHIKGAAPNYLFLPREAAPDRFWRLAFPLPYRALIERYSRQNGLDPYLVTALIRQESEFNAKAVSPAKAVGLMQIVPSVARELARKLPLKGFRASQLTKPEVNIRLGIFYFKRLLDTCDGRMEDALASYNAGHSRVTKWHSWGPFSDVSEFAETIPFQQTRDYVQIIYRNAEIYRALYSSVPVPEYEGDDNDDDAPAKPAASSSEKAAAKPVVKADAKEKSDDEAATKPAAKSKSASKAKTSKATAKKPAKKPAAKKAPKAKSKKAKTKKSDD